MRANKCAAPVWPNSSYFRTTWRNPQCPHIAYLLPQGWCYAADNEGSRKIKKTPHQLARMVSGRDWKKSSTFFFIKSVGKLGRVSPGSIIINEPRVFFFTPPRVRDIFRRTWLSRPAAGEMFKFVHTGGHSFFSALASEFILDRKHGHYCSLSKCINWVFSAQRKFDHPRLQTYSIKNIKRTVFELPSPSYDQKKNPPTKNIKPRSWSSPLRNK